MTTNRTNSLEPAFIEAQDVLLRLQEIVKQQVIGRDNIIELAIIALVADGHILLEDFPGSGKTTLAKALGEAIESKNLSTGATLPFRRIQFTPDLLPSDVTGVSIFDVKTERFNFRHGPLFAHVVLADEINRAPAKVQSALLEAMQERQVTIGEKTYKLPEPFLVLATQNPIAQDGTYPLPEAQVDRFMLKVKISHPDRDEERQILDLMGRTSAAPETQQVVTVEDILKAREVINNIYIDDKVKDYIVDMVCCTREPARYEIEVTDFIQLGASPRATVALTLTAKAHAFLRGRGFVTPQDVKSVAQDVLRHRVSVTFEAEAEEKTSETVIQKILDELPVP